MPLPLPEFMRKKMRGPGTPPEVPGEYPPSESDDTGENPLGEPSESDAPVMKGSKANPLKAWVKNKLGMDGAR